MTQDPRLPTLEHPFEMIDTPWGQMEAWRASTMAIGTMGALAQVAAIVRNDAAELEKKTVALDAKRHAVLNTVNRLLKFMSRVDALTSRVEALEAQRKADEATQRKLDEEPLTLPPDIQEYQASTPPEPIGDESHQPGGELHPVAAKEEPSLDDDLTDNLGDLPAELRDLPDPAPEPKGSVLPPPTALFGS
jgi:cell division protein ZapA (FtsZ GTPase activity inhibitor)